MHSTQSDTAEDKVVNVQLPALWKPTNDSLQCFAADVGQTWISDTQTQLKSPSLTYLMSWNFPLSSMRRQQQQMISKFQADALLQEIGQPQPLSVETICCRCVLHKGIFNIIDSNFPSPLPSGRRCLVVNPLVIPCLRACSHCVNKRRTLRFHDRCQAKLYFGYGVSLSCKREPTCTQTKTGSPRGGGGFTQT